MAGTGEHVGDGGASGSDAPGPLSRLIEELARAPEGELLATWHEGLRPDDRVGRFEIRRELGRGGFGAVFEGYDPELGRAVALKVMRPGRTRRELSAGWIKKEAEAIARLHHSNIVTLHDVGTCPAGPFLVMELLEGETLARRLSHGPLAVGDALRIAEEVARGLAHAHQRGVLHRDLKPANVFLCDDGSVKLLDFGLAHLLGREPGTRGGTPAYMAPEQVRGGAVDERADVFAAAMVLAETLTGSRPGEETARPRAALPPPVARIVMPALSPDPADRPRDGNAWLAEVRAARRNVERRRLARRAVLAIAALLLLVGLAEGVASFRERRRPHLPGHVTVAVADVVNETGDPELDGLSGLLIAALQQSERLRVLTRGRILDLLRDAGQGGAGPVDETRAREVARRAGAGALLLASVRRLDEVYVLELRGIGPGGDEYLFALKEEATRKAALPQAIDRISLHARAALRDPGPEARDPAASIAALVTADLAAHRHYFLGKDCVDRALTVFDRLACAGELERAVAADPGFALAWLQLALVRFWSGSPLHAREAIANAMRWIERAPPRERVLVRALASQIAGDEDAAIPLYREAAAAAPEDRGIQAMAADFFLTRGDIAASVPYWRRAMELEPAGEATHAFYLAKVLNWLGRQEELAALAEELARKEPTRSTQRALYRARAGLGDWPGAAEAARHAGPDSLSLLAVELPLPTEWNREAEPPDVLVRILRTIREGRFRLALTELEKVDSDSLPRDGWEDHHLAAAIAARAGAAEVAWREARAATDLEPVLAAGVAAYLADAGDLDHADTLARRLVAGSPRERNFRAIVAWRRGNREGALALLEPLARETPLFAYPGGPSPLFLQAALLAELGRDAETLEALRRYRTIYAPGLDRFLEHPRALLLAAGSHERRGDLASARAAVEELLALWRHADADQPLLAEARALCRRVACGAR